MVQEGGILAHNLEKVIEKPCSDILAHMLEVCKGIPTNQWVPGYKIWSWLMENVYNLCWE
jgi:hypothetical protein